MIDAQGCIGLEDWSLLWYSSHESEVLGKVGGGGKSAKNQCMESMSIVLGYDWLGGSWVVLGKATVGLKEALSGDLLGITRNQLFLNAIIMAHSITLSSCHTTFTGMQYLECECGRI